MSNLLRAPKRMVRSRIFESDRWSDYQPRADDIIIGTYPKCGTTWMQQIVSMLVFKSAAVRPIWDLSPWPDMRIFGPAEAVLAAAGAQTHRRFFKTHLPLDALPMYEGVKFIHVARDGRDAAMSFHNHMFNFTAYGVQLLDEASRNDPRFGDDFPPVPESAAAYFAQWVTDGGGAYGDEGASFFHMENSYWAERTNSNVLLVHYNDLKADRAGEMRRIAAFLDIEIPDARWPEIIAAAGFDAMKAHADDLIPVAHMLWDDGASRFLHKGTNGRWQDVVSDEDLARYDVLVATRFTPDLAGWVAGGRHGSGPRRQND